MIVYKLVLIGIGLWASKRIHNETDFLLGGRNLGAWVAGLSYAASTSSAWVLLGFTGFVFSQGVAALWMLPGIWGGYVAVWVWFGPRLRSEASDNEWLTPTDFLCARVEGKWRGRIAALAATLILAHMKSVGVSHSLSLASDRNLGPSHTHTATYPPQIPGNIHSAATP